MDMGEAGQGGEEGKNILEEILKECEYFIKTLEGIK